MAHARITGWGKYLPERVMTNSDIEKLVDTSDEWIVTRTGIKERHIVGDDEATSTMAVVAGRRALEVARLPSEHLDMVIVATDSPDKVTPASAAYVQHAIGATDAAAFDIVAGCSGFIYALVTAYQFIASGSYKNILVVGSEALTRLIDWEDRSTCVLFGDGAGAVVVQANDKATDMLGFVMGNDGSGADKLYASGPCDKRTEVLQNGHYYLRMDGREVFRFAVNALVESSKQVIAKAGLKVSDIDLFIPHQANTRITQSAIKSLGIKEDKVFVNLDRYGNLSAASPVVALCEAAEQGRIKDGDLVVLVAFGAGLSWASMVMRWQPNG
ncbi:MAG: beta-ketoacyl-ACP synthase III [Chloroflexota bacterium]|nr:beta-ketoacyl-ACP synthase III [Chloroflexota bacterium]